MNFQRYLVGLAAVVAALALRGLMDPWLGDRVPFITLFGAVIVAAWFGGVGPALVAAAVGYLGADYLFITPRFTLDFRGGAQVVELAGYLVSCALIAALGGAMQASRQRAGVIDERFRRFMQYSPAMVFLKDEESRYVYMNRAAEEFMGLSPAAGIGRTDAELLPAETAATIRGNDVRVLKTQQALNSEIIIPRPGGARRFHSTKFPLQDAAGRRLIGSVTVDITAEKRIEEELQLVTDTMSVAVARLSAEDRYLWVNRVYAEWHAKKPEEIVGRTTTDVLGEQAAREIRPFIQRVLKGEPVRYERLVDYPGLGRRWASALYSPTFDEHGRPSGWVAVVSDIDERRRMEEALRVADRRKDEFLATLAHELRNPLAPIRNAVAILARKGGLDEELAWSRDVIDRQVDQMSRLIDDLLDLARISSGKLSVRKQRTELGAVLDIAIETARPHIDAAGHRLTTRLHAARAIVEVDTTRLGQVFANLLNNAAKYTDRGGAIELTAEVEGAELVVAVQDTGLGFPPELAKEIFEPFSQWAAANDRAPGGLGIGLALVRGIVALHGGSVEAMSRGPGLGSRFVVRLPLATSQAEVASAAQAGAVASGAGMRVLVADDNRDAADSLQRILALFGYEVCVAYDGAAAIELERSFAPRVAVLDIGMPRANGYEVARAVRERRGKAVTLIALTGWGQEEDRRRAAEAGFDHHLTKPVDLNTLHRLLVSCS